MALLPPVVATLLADTREYRAKMDDAIAKTLEFAGVSKEASAGITSSFVGLGKALAPIAAGVGIATDLALKFSENVDRLRTQTNATKAEADAAGKAILALAASTGATQQQLFDGMIQIEKTGVRGAAAQNLLTEATKGSITSGADLASTIQTLLAAQKLNIAGLGDAHNAMALFNTAISDSNMNMADLNAALSGKALTAMQGYHISVKDTLAVLETFANAGFKGSAASMQLYMTLNKLETPAKHTQDILAKIGLTQEQVVAGLSKPGGVVSSFEMLRSRALAAGVPVNQLSAFFAQLFGAGRTGAGAALLINNIDQTRQHLDNLTSGVADYNQKVQEALNSPAQQIKILQQSLTTALTNLGIVTLPIAIDVVKGLTSVLQNQSEMKMIGEGLAVAIAGNLGAKMAGVGLAIARAFGVEAATADLANPIGAAIALAVVTYFAAKQTVVDPTKKYLSQIAGAPLNYAQQASGGLTISQASKAGLVPNPDPNVQQAYAAMGMGAPLISIAQADAYYKAHGIPYNAATGLSTSGSMFVSPGFSTNKGGGKVTVKVGN